MKRKTLWDEEVMLRSRVLLETLKAQGLDLVLIGGWAVYMLTRYHMSRDIDFLMRERELWKLRSYIQAHGGREKAPGIKKMGFVIDDVGIDVYTESLSALAVDISEVFEKEQYIIIEGYKVLEPGRLILLKLDAASARGHSHKGMKDRCDILSLCLKDRTYLEDFRSLVRGGDDPGPLDRLKGVIKEADIEFEYVFGERIIPSKVRRMKKEILDVL